MTIQSSGPIYLDNLQTEFGGSNPIKIEEYYQGGPYIGAGIYPNTVPTSGPIYLQNFYGTQATHAYAGAGSATFSYNAIMGYSIDYFNGSLKITVGYWGSGSSGAWTQLTNYTGTAATAAYQEVAQFVLTAANANTTLYATGASGYVKHPCNCIFGNPIYAYGQNVAAQGGSTGAPGAAWMIAVEWNGNKDVRIWLNPSRNGTGDTGTSESMAALSSCLNALNGGWGSIVPIGLTLSR